jgi:hypothetical protein
MNRSTILLSAVVGWFTGCVAPPYYGRPVTKDSQGKLICGLHGTPVTARNGYSYNGFISGTEDFEFAARRFPNVMGVGFSDKFDKPSFTRAGVRFICEECQKAHERLDKLPMWYKRLLGKPAEARRERQLLRAAKKAQRTGNPQDAKLPDGAGFVSRVL